MRCAIALSTLAWIACTDHVATQRQGDARGIVGTPSLDTVERIALVIATPGTRSASTRDLVTALERHGVHTILASPAPAQGTPERFAIKADFALRHALKTAQTARIVIVGYRDGASIAPFVANRLSRDLRSRIDLVAMDGLAPRVSFAHSNVWFARQPRPTDLPVLPELERLRGTRLLCIDRAPSERTNFCATLAPELIERVVVRSNGRERAPATFAHSILASLNPP